MTVKGMTTCAHCGALLTAPICAICGKSDRDEVEVVDAPTSRARMDDDDRRQIRNLGVFVAAVIVIGVVGYMVMNRESVEPIPAALATPASTTSTTTVAAPTVDPPTIARPQAPAEPLVTLPLTVTVGSGAANPWNGAPPRNVLTGALLDNTDYEPGIAAVATMLANAPAAFVFTEPLLAEWNGVDLAAAETAQPFAARGVADDSGSIADVWVFARGGSANDGSAALLDQARLAWPTAEPLDSFSPQAGVRIHQVSDDGVTTVWVDARDATLIVYRAPAGTDPALLGAISADWI